MWILESEMNMKFCVVLGTLRIWKYLQLIIIRTSDQNFTEKTYPAPGTGVFEMICQI